MRSGVASPKAGEITTVGPVHFDLRATTSASKLRLANEAFGCALILCQASFVGMVSWLRLADKEQPSTGRRGRQRPGFPQHRRWGVAALSSSWLQGQPGHGGCEVTDCRIAVQNAFPNVSSAQAAQLDGSPVHVTLVEVRGCEDDKGKMVFVRGPVVPCFRRSGMAG